MHGAKQQKIHTWLFRLFVAAVAAAAAHKIIK